jgi:ATP-dependent Clp protease ATP-binding subunit ClpA
MPKINVYLPNDLAAAVRSAGVPVSPVCQRALADAVRSASRARAVVSALRDPALGPDRFAEVIAETEHGLTTRLMGILESTIATARAQRPAGTGQLLTGLLDEGSNLAVRILQALDVDLDELREAVSEIEAGGQAAEQAAGDWPSGGEPSLIRDLTMAARAALAVAIESAVGLGHNYVGSEHLLLGLLAGQDTIAGLVLRQQGVQAADVRRALQAALAGFTHGRQAAGQPQLPRIEDLVRRIEAVEERLAALG